MLVIIANGHRNWTTFAEGFAVPTGGKVHYTVSSPSRQISKFKDLRSSVKQSEASDSSEATRISELPSTAPDLVHLWRPVFDCRTWVRKLCCTLFILRVSTFSYRFLPNYFDGQKFNSNEAVKNAFYQFFANKFPGQRNHKASQKKAEDHQSTVKELGVVMYNCSSVAEDLGKLFDAYWLVGNTTSLPNKWPDSLSTVYNMKNPFKVKLNEQNTLLYISSAPPVFSPPGRTDDIDALLETIRRAKKYIHISVMNYSPLILFGKGSLKFWPVIDDELRKAVIEREVEVRLLISKWRYSKSMEINFLRSLMALNKFKKNAVLEVKLFMVPSNDSQSQIPYARVNHNKYMVTDNGVLIGTSNWSGDYFVSTGGVSLISFSTNNTTSVLQEKLHKIFERDWNSNFTRYLYPESLKSFHNKTSQSFIKKDNTSNQPEDQFLVNTSS